MDKILTINGEQVRLILTTAKIIVLTILLICGIVFCIKHKKITKEMSLKEETIILEKRTKFINRMRVGYLYSMIILELLSNNAFLVLVLCGIEIMFLKAQIISKKRDCKFYQKIIVDMNNLKKSD